MNIGDAIKELAEALRTAPCWLQNATVWGHALILFGLAACAGIMNDLRHYEQKNTTTIDVVEGAIARTMFSSRLRAVGGASLACIALLFEIGVLIMFNVAYGGGYSKTVGNGCFTGRTASGICFSSLIGVGACAAILWWIPAVYRYLNCSEQPTSRR